MWTALGKAQYSAAPDPFTFSLRSLVLDVTYLVPPAPKMQA